jgi:hypothetical protein
MVLAREDEVVWLEWEVYSSHYPISKAAWGTGVVQVRKGSKQAIVLAMGRKCTKRWSNKGIPSHALQPFTVPTETRQVPNHHCLLYTGNRQ